MQSQPGMLLVRMHYRARRNATRSPFSASCIRQRVYAPPLPILAIPRRQNRIPHHQQVLGVVTLRCRGAAGDGRRAVDYHHLVVRDRHVGIDPDWDAGIVQICRRRVARAALGGPVGELEGPGGRGDVERFPPAPVEAAPSGLIGTSKARTCSAGVNRAAWPARWRLYGATAPRGQLALEAWSSRTG
jgi:hypothetical protein